MTAQTETATVERPEESGTARPMRADAKRNYELLVAAARKVFDQEGGGASMEAIAKEAGVGIGTLYRHFPKRIDVVEAVYVDDVDELEHVARTVSDELEPWPAFVAWLEAFVRYASGKKRFMNELHEAFDKDPTLRSASRERIEGALGIVLVRVCSTPRRFAARASVRSLKPKAAPHSVMAWRSASPPSEIRYCCRHSVTVSSNVGVLVPRPDAWSNSS